MAITADEPVFPNNVSSLMHARVQLIDTDLFVVQRPLRKTDPNQSVGIIPVQWSPEEESQEMGGFEHNMPTLNQYIIGVQAFVKDMEEERGLAVHSVLSARLRSMLYRDHALRVGFASLAVTDPLNGSTERVQRWGIRTQRFIANEIDATFLYLSTLEFWLETETT